MTKLKAALSLFFVLASLVGASAASSLFGFGAYRTDIYALDYTTSTQPWYTDTSGKTSVSCAITPGQSTLVLLVVGQSLVASSAPTPYTPSNTTAHALSILDGNCYRASDPLLGTTGQPPSGATYGGTYLSKLIDNIITAGKFQRVILVMSSIGGTSVNDWSPLGPWNGRLRVALLYLRSKGWVGNADVTIRALYDQGQQDVSLGTSSAAWQASFAQVVGTINGFGIGAPKICVATDTMVSNATNATIQGAQAAVVGTFGGQVATGPNIDSLTGGNRQADGTHLSDTGTTNAAALAISCVAP